MPVSKTTNAQPEPSPHDKAVGILCNKCLHRSLWLPETLEHSRLRVTFSTSTNFDDSTLPVVFVIGPMFGSRWSSLWFDKIARDSGVRLICTDRPGMGGSTPVDISIRMRVWLETVPAILQKLDIQQVNFMTHSAGTIYTLNTLLHHRTFLNPKAPYVAFLAPYVPTSASGATLTTWLAKLPTGMIDSLSGLNAFINTKILPTASWSGGMLSASAGLFSSALGTGASTDVPGSAEASSSTTSAERFGVDDETAKQIDKLSPKFQFAEDTTAASEEAKLCLRKFEGEAWGDAVDFGKCILQIAENERDLCTRQPETKELRVEGFFAGSDIMSGKPGQEYFEECWERDEVAGMIDWRSRTYDEANHDSVLVDYKKGALWDVLEKIAELGRSM